MEINVKDIISLVGLLLTIGGFVWKASAMSSQLKENSKDIDGIAKKIREKEEYEVSEREEFNTITTNLSNRLIAIETKIDLIIEKKVL